MSQDQFGSGASPTTYKLNKVPSASSDDDASSSYENSSQGG